MQREPSQMQRFKKPILVAICSVPILVISFLISNQIEDAWKCRAIKMERENSSNNVRALKTKALKEWDSFPLYEGDLQGRDPSPGVGGRIYSNFEEYFESFYASKVAKEEVIRDQLVLNHPQCFSPREVVEILEGLTD